MPNQIYTTKFEGLRWKTYIIGEDKLYKGLVHDDGGGQFKKFTTESSSKALPLFYILLRVNIDVKKNKKMENI